MSRIGRKPITMPSTVKYTVEGNVVVVQGPKGKVETRLPAAFNSSSKTARSAPSARMIPRPLSTGSRARSSSTPSRA